MQYYLAIDIGASSGRHILSSVQDGRMVLEEIYRFDNKQLQKNGHDCWDITYLWDCILQGMRVCKDLDKIPTSVGIDTWAVDFVLVNEVGECVSDAVAYRDARTQGVRQMLEETGTLLFDDHYATAGIQYQPFNTIYQLCALKQEHPEQLDAAYRMLMIPDYFHYLLTGTMMQDYTNASSTALLNAQSNQWDDVLIAKLGLPRGIFADIAMPGQTVGFLQKNVQETVGYNCKVVLPATHDTGSAFLAVPATTDTAVYISSGTWSLLGVENEHPITTPESMAQNFTNEGGYHYRYRYLKNIMGLWMIQSIRRELNGLNYIEGKENRGKAEKQYGFAELCDLAAAASDFTTIIDVDDEAFLAPESMIDAVKKACAESGQAVPESIGELMQCVYASLAHKYSQAIEELQRLTGKTYTCIHIVGGGSNATYLNELCAKATGLPVYAGPTEGTALGNAMVQMLADNQFEDLAAARLAIPKSFEIKEINP